MAFPETDEIHAVVLIFSPGFLVMLKDPSFGTGLELLLLKSVSLLLKKKLRAMCF